MKVEIVDKKEDDVKEMTIEELEQRRFIGLEVNGSKYFKYTSISMGISNFINALGQGATGWKRPYTSCLESANLKGQLHVFDNARELYLWMAE